MIQKKVEEILATYVAKTKVDAEPQKITVIV
jgi:hypothetical protein